MKRYSLLRDNQESGPYTIHELKSLGITTTDLIWIESEGTAWIHPTEINELKNIAVEGIKVPLRKAPVKTYPESNESLFYAAITSQPLVDAKPGAVSDVDVYTNLLNEKEDFQWRPNRKKKSLPDVTNGFFGLGVLLVGVMLCAFVVKKLVDHFEFEPRVASSQAIEISRESLPNSASSHAAKTNSQAIASPAFVNVSTLDSGKALVAAAVSKPVIEKKQKADTPIVKVENKTTPEITISGPEEPEAKPIEEKAEEAPVVKKAPTLGISANDYKVGVFGGVSELALSINNPSSQAVENAVVEVEFLKPNGSVVKSQTLSVENISAGSAKTVAVPSSSRGVKVRFRVISVNGQNQ